MSARCLAVLMTLTSAGALPQPVPHTPAENGNGKKGTFPDLILGHLSILVVGFSKGSRDASTFWADRLERDAAASRTTVLRVAHLESIPGILRGVLLGDIKNGVPQERREVFWMLFQNQDAWKRLMNFDSSNDAYIAVVNARGQVVWRTHGGVDEAAYLKTRGPLLAALSAAETAP